MMRSLTARTIRPHFLFPLLVLAVMGISCTGTRSVLPIKKEQQRIDISLGGPFVKVFGMYMPMPVSSIAYTRGINDRMDWFAALHPTAGLFGITVLESGITYQISNQDSYMPAFTTSPSLFLMTQFKPDTWRIYPDLQINGVWQTGKHWYLYTGLSTFFEFHSDRAFESDQKYSMLFSPLVGTEFTYWDLQFQFELKYYAFNADSKYIAPDYLTFGDNGALGLLIAIKKTW